MELLSVDSSQRAATVHALYLQLPGDSSSEAPLRKFVCVGSRNSELPAKMTVSMRTN